MDINEQEVSRIVREVISRMDTSAPSPVMGASSNGTVLFERMSDAVEAAKRAQKIYASMGLELRRKVVEAMREASRRYAEPLARMAQEETGMGRADDKVVKNLVAANKTPGVDDLQPEVFTGDRGMTLIERGPFGVIGSVTPSTNPSATVINNSICIIAAGNAVVYAPHPAAKKVSQETMKILNDAILSAGGPANLITGMIKPTLEGAQEMFTHPDVKLLIATGGPAVIRVIMQSGKKVIAAGPGNPPVVVDSSADPHIAADSIISGASFDNGVLCTAEKEVLLADGCEERVLAAVRADRRAYELSPAQMDKLASLAIKEGGRGVEPVLDRKFVGKDASVIAAEIGVSVPPETKLLWGLVDENHPYMWTEQLMPVLPFAVTGSVERSIELAVEMEGLNGHTALMHSMNVDNLTKMARSIACSIFVKNGPSFMGLGMGEGYATLSIATPTGDGLVKPRNFTRPLRCVLVDNFRIV